MACAFQMGSGAEQHRGQIQADAVGETGLHGPDDARTAYLPMDSALVDNRSTPAADRGHHSFVIYQHPLAYLLGMRGPALHPWAPAATNAAYADKRHFILWDFELAAS